MPADDDEDDAATRRQRWVSFLLRDQVDGYTDDQGSAAHGLVLSRRRADAVRDVLAPLISAQGVKIKTRGRGEADPRFPNRDKSGREIPKNQAKNRRVEITFSSR